MFFINEGIKHFDSISLFWKNPLNIFQTKANSFMTFPYWYVFIVKDLDNTTKWYKEESENLKYLKYLKLITVHINNV